MANANKKLKQNEERFEQQRQDEAAEKAAAIKAENRKTHIQNAIRAVLYAAIYCCLTLLMQKIPLGQFNFSFGMFQCRLTEAMMGLVFFDPAAAPGIIIGCFAADLFGAGLYDAMVGTVASMFGFYFIKFLAERGGKPITGLAMHALINAVMLGVMYSYSAFYVDYGMLLVFAAILVGEIIAAVGGGMIVYKIADRVWEDILSQPKQETEPTPDIDSML